MSTFPEGKEFDNQDIAHTLSIMVDTLQKIAEKEVFKANPGLNNMIQRIAAQVAWLRIGVMLKEDGKEQP